ncbi:ribosomal RNA processing protein 36 homolog [Aplochiton taeniatus]
MEGKGKQRKLTSVSPDASSEEDSDLDTEMERNFALLSKTAPETTKEEEGSESDGEEEEDELSGDERQEEEAVPDEEEEEEEEEGSESDGEEEEDDELSGDERQEEAVPDEEEEEEEDDDDDDDEQQTGSEAESEDADAAQLEDQSGDIKTEEDVKKELSSMSFEEVLKLQNAVGTKVFKEIAYGTSSKAVQNPTRRKRLNKNRPMEMSAKRPAPFLRQVAPVKKSVHRDPRFDDLSGEYKPEIFEQTYNFINTLRKREKEVVSKKFKSVKDNKKKEQLGFLLKRMENQERARQQREQQREKELDFKRRQRAMAGDGLQPFFLKKSDKKKMELAEKYNQLKKSGKLENFLSKKRKRNATKDRRKLPFQNPKPQ